MKYTEEQLKEAHKLSMYNKESLAKSDKCGCFYCQKIFKPNKIKEWCDKGGRTALCPCGIDSILASHDIDINKELLEQMHEHYFRRRRES